MARCSKRCSSCCPRRSPSCSWCFSRRARPTTSKVALRALQRAGHAGGAHRSGAGVRLSAAAHPGRRVPGHLVHSARSARAADGRLDATATAARCSASAIRCSRSIDSARPRSACSSSCSSTGLRNLRLRAAAAERISARRRPIVEWVNRVVPGRAGARRRCGAGRGSVQPEHGGVREHATAACTCIAFVDARRRRLKRRTSSTIVREALARDRRRHDRSARHGAHARRTASHAS